jgi:predicted DCC family thiol-disulfide oxidoreductase YuxK
LLAHIYERIDGRRRGLVEVLKKEAMRLLSQHPQSCEAMLRATTEKGEGRGSAAAQTVLSNLQEDLNALRRLSRVPDHERGDCRKLILSSSPP